MVAARKGVCRDILNTALNVSRAGSADADQAKWRVTRAMLKWEKREIGHGA